MSIYATLWKLKFPMEGDECLGWDWIEVTAQAVPPHIGTPTPGLGYPDGSHKIIRDRRKKDGGAEPSVGCDGEPAPRPLRWE